MNDLLRGSYGFHLSPDEWNCQGKREFANINPTDALASGMNAYFSPQLNGAWSAIVIRTDKDITKKKLAWEKYNVLPQWTDGKFILFRLESLFDDNIYKKWSEALAWIYEGESCSAFPYTGNAVATGFGTCHTKDIEIISGIYRLISSEDINKLNLSLENSEIANHVQKDNKIEEIAKYTGISEWSYDESRNIVTYPREYSGSPFFHVLRRVNGDVRDAMEWFNTNKQYTFKPNPEDFIDTAEGSGYLVETGRGFNISADGYNCDVISNGKLMTKKMGDFHIRVMYRVIGTDGVIVNWVKIINPMTKYETPELKFPTESGKTPFTNWLIKYGFPFFGSQENVVDVHEQISRAPVPKIENIIGLGFKKNLLFVENGVWDVKERKFSKRNGKFWFSPNGNGYSCVMSNGNPVEDLKKLPSIPELPSELPTPSEIAMKAKELYSGDSGLKAWAWLYGAIGFGAMLAQGSCPMFTVFGVKGAGKTEMNKIMARAFGYKETYSLESTTLFALRMAFSHFERIPLFLSEYRREIPHHDQKTQLLRSTYDRSSFSHGTAELKIISYDFSCLPSIDGEEAISDPAVRSRSIQHFLSKNDQAEGGVKAFNEKKSDKAFDYTLASYLTYFDQNQAEYAKYRSIGTDFIESAESRIRENLGIIYAGCMIAAPDLQSEWERIIKEIGKAISNDMESSSGVKEFLKKIGMYAPQIFGLAYVTSNYALIDLGVLVDHFSRRKVKMNLDIETYIQYAERAGYVIDYFEFGQDGMRQAMKINIEKDIDRAFLSIPEIYKVWKEKFNN